MARRLLRDGRIVVDDWIYWNEHTARPDHPAPDHPAPGSSTPGRPAPSRGFIMPLDLWLAERPASQEGSVGVLLSPSHKVETLVPHLARIALIAVEFPGPAEGRGYTQGRLLRERHGFAGELRAIGHVGRDQVFLLARCGFNSFELPERELNAVDGMFNTFSARYQPANDAGLPRKLEHR